MMSLEIELMISMQLQIILDLKRRILKKSRTIFLMTRIKNMMPMAPMMWNGAASIVTQI